MGEPEGTGIRDTKLHWWAASEQPPAIKHVYDVFLGENRSKKEAECFEGACNVKLPAAPPQWDNYQHHSGIAFCADFLDRFSIFFF